MVVFPPKGSGKKIFFFYQQYYLESQKNNLQLKKKLLMDFWNIFFSFYSRIIISFVQTTNQSSHYNNSVDTRCVRACSSYFTVNLEKKIKIKIKHTCESKLEIAWDTMHHLPTNLSRYILAFCNKLIPIRKKNKI